MSLLLVKGVKNLVHMLDNHSSRYQPRKSDEIPLV